MITQEALSELARRSQTSEFPNIAREYVQHVFLSELYKASGAEHILFKGGTALRVVYGSPRYSEDLDFSLSGVAQSAVRSFIEGLYEQVLIAMEQTGIEVGLGEKIGTTSGGYFGVAAFRMYDYPPVNVAINVSARGSGGTRGEIDTVANEYLPTYSLIHVPQRELVEEKIFGALRGRKKPRDFYDLYFIMRRGMLSSDQKKRLAALQDEILADAKNVNFRSELGVFLPVGQQMIIRDFPATLERELKLQLAGA